MYILSVILNPSIFHFGTKNLSKKSEMIGYDTYIITYEICNVSFMKKKENIGNIPLPLTWFFYGGIPHGSHHILFLK